MFENLCSRLGFTKHEQKKIKNSYSLRKYTEKTLVKRLYKAYTFISSLGLNKKETCKIIVNCPTIGGTSPNTLSKKIENLANLGFQGEEITKIVKRNSKILSYSMDTVKDKFEFFTKLGMEKELVIKMFLRYPKLFSSSIELYQIVIKTLKDFRLEFTNEDIFTILSGCPQIYGLDLDKVRDRVKLLKDKNISNDEIREMIVNFPNILSQKQDNLEKKLDIYFELGLMSLIIKDSKRLMQSIDLTIKRMCFIRDREKELAPQKYFRIFNSQKAFQSLYGIDNEGLDTLYGNEVKNMSYKVS